MTPENRERMRSILRDSLRRAYLPGSHGHAPAHADAHGHGQVAATGSHHASPTIVRPADAVVPLTYAGTPAVPLVPGDAEVLTTRFCQEIEALAGVTYRAEGAEAIADHIASIVARSGTTESIGRGANGAGASGRALIGWDMEDIGVPGLGEALAARGLSFVSPELPFADPARAERLGVLAAMAVGLTGAQAAIAESGSLVLVSGPGRGRLASLLTPVHIAILHRDRIVPTLSDLFRLHPDLTVHGSNVVIITGPSRTADIEMTLTRGVHGPGQIHVILI